MSEILEVFRGPVLGLIFVIIALAGIIVTAAFAADRKSTRLNSSH